MFLDRAVRWGLLGRQSPPRPRAQPIYRQSRPRRAIRRLLLQRGLHEWAGPSRRGAIARRIPLRASRVAGAGPGHRRDSRANSPNKSRRSGSSAFSHCGSATSRRSRGCSADSVEIDGSGARPRTRRRRLARGPCSTPTPSLMTITAVACVHEDRFSGPIKAPTAHLTNARWSFGSLPGSRGATK